MQVGGFSEEWAPWLVAQESPVAVSDILCQAKRQVNVAGKLSFPTSCRDWKQQACRIIVNGGVDALPGGDCLERMVHLNESTAQDAAP